MTPAVYLYDDPADTPLFQPFSQSRPIGELRYGAWLLRERVERVAGPVAGSLCASHLSRFVDVGAPPVVEAPPAGATHIVLRSTFVPSTPAPAGLTKGAPCLRFTDGDGATVGALLAPGTAWAGSAVIAAEWPATVWPGIRLRGVWQLVENLPDLLRADLAARHAAHRGDRVPAGCTVLGDAADVLLDEGAQVEPLVVFDTRNGPIWIRSGAEIRSGTRLAGPLVVGEHSRIVGGQLRESSIGPLCVVHGEVSNSVFLGYANKAHDGFLGHTVVGRWANLGAGTITSNLKNTYGPVRLNFGEARVETGLTFLGSLVGDHVKTAIGTMLPTGCVLGTGANVFGTARPSATVPPFAWGTDEPGRITVCRAFLQTASRVLPRRGVELNDDYRAYLTAVFEAATGKPCS